MMSNSKRQATLGEYQPAGVPPDTFYDPEKGWGCTCGSERKRCKHVLMAMWAQRNFQAPPGLPDKLERLENARGIAEEVLQRMADEHEEDVGVLLTVLLTAAAASPDGTVTTDAIWDTLGEDWNKDPDGTDRVSAKINGSVVREATKGTGWFEKVTYVNSHRTTCHGRPVLKLKLTDEGRKQVAGRGAAQRDTLKPGGVERTGLGEPGGERVRRLGEQENPEGQLLTMSENLCRCGRRLVKNQRLMEDECAKCRYPPDQCRCPKVQEPPERKDGRSPSPKDKWAGATRKFQRRSDAHQSTLGGRPMSLDRIRNYKERKQR